jgi:pimeloyl-ACP methyl ester carboxylesterase
VNVYFISGLGADCRIFKNIQLPGSYNAVHLEWIKPLADESLAEYALRLSEAIDATQPFGLIGLSLGGMIAVEISKHKTAEWVVLISSIPVSNALPKYYHLGGKLGLHKIIPISMLRQASFIKRFFSSEAGGDKALLREMIRNIDPDFLRWGMGAILGWRNEIVPRRLVHIHGSADRILPKWLVSPTHTIRGGGHLFVMSRALEVNNILKAVLHPADAVPSTT